MKKKRSNNAGNDTNQFRHHTHIVLGVQLRRRPLSASSRTPRRDAPRWICSSRSVRRDRASLLYTPLTLPQPHIHSHSTITTPHITADWNKESWEIEFCLTKDSILVQGCHQLVKWSRMVCTAGNLNWTVCVCVYTVDVPII